MQSYGRIKKNQLELFSNQIEGTKPVIYEGIPDNFDQTTHYATQKAPVEEDDRIFIGIKIHVLPDDLESEEFDEDVF